jgi:hypothetical protein
MEQFQKPLKPTPRFVELYSAFVSDSHYSKILTDIDRCFKRDPDVDHNWTKNKVLFFPVKIFFLFFVMNVLYIFLDGWIYTRFKHGT